MFTPSYGRDLIEGMLVGLGLTGISYLIGYHFGWFAEDINYTNLSMEIAGVILNYACVWLTTRQSIVAWPLGIAAVLFLGGLYYSLGLYASLVLSIGYFLPIQIWGWWNWLYGGNNNTELKVSWIKFPNHLYFIMIGGVSFYLIAQLNGYFGAAAPFLDTGILVVSIIAQFLLGQKKVESWMLWVIVNIISIYVYSTSGAYLVGFQYLMFLGNAFFGMYQWISSWNQERTGHAISNKVGFL